jgi:hypothetical protein
MVGVTPLRGARLALPAAVLGCRPRINRRVATGGMRRNWRDAGEECARDFENREARLALLERPHGADGR